MKLLSTTDDCPLLLPFYDLAFTIYPLRGKANEKAAVFVVPDFGNNN